MSPPGSVALPRKLAFAAIAWALFLVAAEGLLALSEPLWAVDAPNAVPLTRKEQDKASEVLLGAKDQRQMADTLRFHVRSNVLTQHDPDLLFRVKSNRSGAPIHDYTGINAQGFRGRTIEAPPPGARSIVLLGDSCGFGWGIHDYNETIAGQLEEAYEQAPPETQPRAVFNLSQPGYSSEQARMLFERWETELRPDLVVIYLGWNDLFLSGSEDRQTLERLRIANAGGLRLARETHLYRALEHALGLVRGSAARSAETAPGAVRRVAPERSIENLRRIAETTRARGAFVVIIPPPGAHWTRNGGMPEFIAGLREALSDSVLFLELPRMQTSTSEHTDHFIADGFHPNPRGATHIANQILRADIALERNGGAWNETNTAP